MTGLVDRPAQGLYLVLMIVGVVAVYVAVFRLWHPGTASTRGALLLGRPGSWSSSSASVIPRSPCAGPVRRTAAHWSSTNRSTSSGRPAMTITLP